MSQGSIPSCRSSPISNVLLSLLGSSTNKDAVLSATLLFIVTLTDSDINLCNS